MEVKGKKYLKITGILMIIFGIIIAVLSLVGLSRGLLLAEAAATAGEVAVGKLSILIIAIFSFTLFSSILEFISGIIGVKNCEKAEKAGTCFKLGIVLIALSFLSTIAQMLIEGFSVQAVIGLLIGLVLPVLFCYGAKLNQQN